MIKSQIQEIYYQNKQSFENINEIELSIKSPHNLNSYRRITELWFESDESDGEYLRNNGLEFIHKKSLNQRIKQLVKHQKK